jgi:hypothetical protein
MKQRIKLTENQLKQVISESIKHHLNELRGSSKVPKFIVKGSRGESFKKLLRKFYARYQFGISNHSPKNILKICAEFLDNAYDLAERNNELYLADEFSDAYDDIASVLSKTGQL